MLVRKGRKLTWNQTMVVVLSGEVAIKTSSTPVLETLTVVRSAEVVVRTKPAVETLVVTRPVAAVLSVATSSYACGR